MRRIFSMRTFLVLFLVSGYLSVAAQGTLIDFNTIPKSGTILIYSHMDDDLIWMLPFWKITEKFIGGAMPATPGYATIVQEQQIFLDNNNYNIDYEQNWSSPWDPISDQEYTRYYWADDPAYSYMVLDHLETRLYNNPNEMSRYEIDKLKAKLEQYFAGPDMSRAITHNNWGEYGHKHHTALNKAVRELAVKYRRDVWMLGCDNGSFTDVYVPSGITYTMGDFNDPDLYLGIRTIYENNGRWTWYTDRIPSGEHRFIKIVDAGVDRSNILTGESIVTPGPYQNEPGAYIFDGSDDYMTLRGNNNSSFTIAMRVRPNQIRAMDIAKMAEYPLSDKYDRNIYMDADGHIIARIFDGSSRIITSSTQLTSGSWAHVAITANGSNLKLYVNGALQNTINTGQAITSYSTPEFILGQASETGSFFNGQISDVRMYNYVMNDSDIASLSGMLYTISAASNSNGSVSPAGTTTVNVGSSLTYTITPNAGYQITDVRVDNISVGAVSSYTFNFITANHTINVTFSPITYPITSSAGPGGAINPSGNINAIQGSSQTFNVSPNAGYSISDVMVDNVSIGAVTTYTFTNVTSSHTIAAQFSPVMFTITATADQGGSINPSGALTVSYGANQAFSIASNLGYRVSDVKVDNVSVGQISGYTFNNIIADHTISVSFNTVPIYTITSTAGTGGSIDPAGELSINQGSSQTYNITANTGYKVSSVLVDGISIGAVSTFTFSNVDTNHTISALFEVVPTYTVIAAAGSGGNITPSGTMVVSEGASRTFLISANPGFRISGVLVDGTSVGSLTSYTFNNIIANHAISVTFEIITYSITASAGVGGSINPEGTIIADHGSVINFVITPNAGYRILEVRVDNTPQGNPASYTFNNITANHTITATFTLITYSISASAGTGGSISPQGDVTVNHGTNRSFTISPNTGYYISNVTVDNISIGAVSSYSFNNITANHTISASFIPVTYIINSGAGANGTISPQGDVTVNHGSDRAFTITPNFGFQVADVRIDNVSIGAVSSFTFNNITTNHSISASFTTATYTITGSAGTGGSIDPQGEIVVNHGATRTYAITPNTGYRISDVRVNDVSVGPVSTYTFNNISDYQTITASFSLITYSIASSAGSGGSINPEGTVTVNYGTARTFTVTPDNGYQVSDVRIDNISVGPVPAYTFYNVTGDHSVSVTFIPVLYTITGNSGPGGSISPSGAVTLNHGSTQTFVIAPTEGYLISDVKVDNISVGNVTTYTFNNITGSHSISATFIPITYTITSSYDAGGIISPSGTAAINYGNSHTSNIVPDEGYQIADVTVDGNSVGIVPAYTFSNVRASHAISAVFTLKTYSITAISSPGGSVTPEGEITVSHGESRTYTFTPEEGYMISDIRVNSVSVGTASNYSLNAISGDYTIEVRFSLIKTYNLIASTGNGGSITPAGTVQVYEGSSQVYTVSPDRGYRISDVFVDYRSVGAVSEYVFNRINADHQINVVFTSDIEYKVYPNPFNDYFILKILSPDEYEFDISVIDMSGKTISVHRNVPGNVETILSPNLAPGIYFARIAYRGRKMVTMKIIRN